MTTPPRRIELLSSRAFTAYPDATEFAPIDFGSAPLQGGILRIPPGKASEPHNHHETEYFVLLQGEHVTLDSLASDKLSDPGDFAAILPFEEHKIENLGENVAILLDIWFEDRRTFERRSQQIHEKMRFLGRPVQIVDRRTMVVAPRSLEVLCAAREQQGWTVEHARCPDNLKTTVREQLLERAWASANLLVDIKSSSIELESHRDELFGAIAAFSITGSFIESVSCEAHSHLDHISHQSLSRAVEQACDTATRLLWPDDRTESNGIIVAFDVGAGGVGACLLELLLITKIVPPAELLRLTLFSEPRSASNDLRDLAQVVSDLERVSESFVTIVNEAFAGKLPIAGRWSSAHVAAFEELEAVKQSALALLEPDRFSLASFVALLHRLPNLAQETLSRLPWGLRNVERFEAEIRTDLALVACALRECACLLEPCQAVLNGRRPILPLALRPGASPWADARRLLPEAPIDPP